MATGRYVPAADGNIESLAAGTKKGSSTEWLARYTGMGLHQRHGDDGGFGQFPSPRVATGSDQGEISSYANKRPSAYLRITAYSAGTIACIRKRADETSSIQVTVDIYGHLVPGGNKAPVDKLDDSSRNDAQPKVNVAQSRNHEKRTTPPAATGG